MILPLNNCKITSEYGIIRNDGKLHKGVDLISLTGDRNVKTIKSGKVSYVGFDATGFGNYVSIHQEDDFRTLYCHLKSASVKKEDLIEAGQTIGIEGSTGNSTGVHLHLEIRKSPYTTNYHINVADYLGIENQKGVVKMQQKTKEDHKKILKEKAGIDDNTIRYLEFYRYGDELIRKLAEAMI